MGKQIVVQPVTRIEGHAKVTIQLDDAGVDSRSQAMYLLHKGIATGRGLDPKAIARKFGLSEAETGAILSSVESLLSKTKY